MADLYDNKDTITGKKSHLEKALYNFLANLIKT